MVSVLKCRDTEKGAERSKAFKIGVRSQEPGVRIKAFFSPGF